MNPFEAVLVEIQKKLKETQTLYDKAQNIITEQQEDIDKLRAQVEDLKNQSVYAQELQIKANAWDQEQSLRVSREETERKLQLLKK